MSTQYAGLPAVARRFWRAFSIAFVGMSALLIFTGALAAVVVLVALPEAIWYLLIGGVVYVLHTAGMFINDVRSGEYEPSQASHSTATELLTMIIIVGAYQSTILLIGTGVGYMAETLPGVPVIFAAVIAAYYPVIDTVLLRRGWRSPGALVAGSVLRIASAILDIRDTVMVAIPVIGPRRRMKH